MRSGDWQVQARGGRRTLVLLPGWATDARLFDGMAPDDDLITPWGMLTGEAAGLADLLAGRGGKPVTLVGWSLGGFAAAAFACRYPELIARVLLVSVRQRYPAAQLAAMRQALAQDRERCLTEFYRQCFLPAQRADYRHFRATLEPAYRAQFATEALLTGLDYLAAAALTPAALPPCPTTLLHGAQDVIVPVAEARRLGDAAGLPVHVVPDAAHAVIMTAACRRLVEETP